jgi:hypothetical protein
MEVVFNGLCDFSIKTHYMLRSGIFHLRPLQICYSHQSSVLQIHVMCHVVNEEVAELRRSIGHHISREYIISS